MMARIRQNLTGLVACLALACLWALPLGAQSVIRDAEIEDHLRALADPIFQAAGLDPGAVDLLIVQDQQLNAFVAGGQNLFINTGLLLRAESPEQVAGVLAHETGHIAGGHLSRAYLARDRAGTEMLIGSILGLAAAAVGAPQLGAAIAAGGLTVAQQGFLSFSRAQEQSADQAAITYLEALDLPPSGLLEFLRILETSSMRLDRGRNPFVRTHPLTQERLSFLELRDRNSPHHGQELDAQTQLGFARSKAKLAAFLGDPAVTLRSYGGAGLVDRYAQAIAYYRIPDLPRALELVDGLIAEIPTDPYFHELKGQILFENGRTAEAIAPYREATRLVPEASMIRFGLARALLEQPGEESTAEAARHFAEVVRREPMNATGWRFLGIAEGRLGHHGASAMALTEAAVLRRDRQDARLYLARAEQNMTPADPAWLRLQDLRRVVEDLPDPR
jgi:predicted Zn-dependent protease